MKLTWTFYPKGETESVTLTVVYTPELDAEKIASGGFLHKHTNTAYVDWATYKRFDTADVEGRKDAFQRLTPISKGIENGLPWLLR
ncbi:hypothetical protein GO755_25835 [Spirosoma sp. HMF4905]|uniref:Uncharacterized protein n=1 Tax=Spirosoma arboris TaxID=2682092 RepID=A0A7K1SIE4_9BACT|nr:hypothetical protein [Spirosoma arboris]MVM33484.1 hypothetical protein [Spirosoma arboris]